MNAINMGKIQNEYDGERKEQEKSKNGTPTRVSC